MKMETMRCSLERKPVKFSVVDFTSEKGFCVGRFVLRFTKARRERGFRGRGSKIFTFEQRLRPTERTLKRYKCYSRQETDDESSGENNCPCPLYRLVTEMHNIVKQRGTGSLKRRMPGGAKEEALESTAHDPYSVDVVQDAINDLQHHITAAQYSAAIQKAEHSLLWRKTFIKTYKIEWKLRLIFDSDSRRTKLRIHSFDGSVLL